MSIGNRISQLRQDKKCSQKDLADYLMLSPSTIGMYEQDRREPDIKTLNKLADYFNVSVDYLIGRTDNPNIAVRKYKGAEFHITKGHENKYTEEDLEKALKIIEMIKENK